MKNADLVFATISVIKVPLIKVHELLLKYLLLWTERLYRLLMVTMYSIWRNCTCFRRYINAIFRYKLLLKTKEVSMVVLTWRACSYFCRKRDLSFKDLKTIDWNSPKMNFLLDFYIWNKELGFVVGWIIKGIHIKYLLFVVTETFSDTLVFTTVDKGTIKSTYFCRQRDYQWYQSL